MRECENLKHVDLVEGELHETITALMMDECTNDCAAAGVRSVLSMSYARSLGWRRPHMT